jgi:hypothetical protein
VRVSVGRSVRSRPSRSVAISLWATRTALRPSVHVCMDLPSAVSASGLAYRLATRSRSDRPQKGLTRPLTCGNASRLSESN